MTPQAATVLFPLLAAGLYSVSAMLVKRSNDLGVGVWRTTFVANLIVAVVYSFLWFLGGPAIDWSLWWQPAIIMLLLYSAQLLQFFALEKGDVSVAVPVFGLKVIIVALITPFLTGESVDQRMLLAAFLAVIGITFLNRKDSGPSRNVGITILTGGLGAVGFAFFDMLVAKWGPHWSAGRLLPLVFWMNIPLTFLLAFKFRAPLSATPTRAWPWLIAGALLLGLQSVLFVSTLAIYGKATAANVIYASRGLVSVLLVWTVGHWFSNTEQALGSKVLRWRLLGSLLMLTAIALVVSR
jgi:drug/metabolite transporter (DMT)-like permease